MEYVFKVLKFLSWIETKKLSFQIDISEKLPILNCLLLKSNYICRNSCIFLSTFIVLFYEKLCRYQGRFSKEKI